MDLTLAEYLKERGPSPTARTRLLLRCAELLQRVHSQGVRHYDVKAANFLMSEDGNRMVRAAAAGGVGAAAGCWDGSLSAAASRLTATRSSALCSVSPFCMATGAV